MLQQSRVLKVIKKKLVTKALEMMRKMSDSEEEGKAEQKEEADKKDDDKKDDEKKDDDKEEEEEEEEEEMDAEKAIKDYKKFYESFAKNIKLGVIEDSKNRKKLTKLLRYKTSASGDKMISLSEYVANMKKGQKHIYFVAGDDDKMLEKSPFLERLRKMGYEALYMTDPIDEYTTQHMDEYEDFKLVNIAKEDLKFDDKTEKKLKAKREKAKEDLKDLIKWLKDDVLKEKVEKIVISSRLTTSPCAIVTGQYGYTAHMERLMKAQALNDASKGSFMSAKKTLEINPRHPMVLSLSDRAKGEDEEAKKEASELANILFDTAAVQAGFDLEDATGFAARVHRMLNTGLKLEPDAKPEEEVETEDPEDDKEEDKEGDDDEKDDDKEEDKKEEDAEEKKDEL